MNRMANPHRVVRAAFAIASLAFSATAKSALVIDVRYSGDPQYASAFENAAITWQSLLGGYQNGFVTATTAMSSYSPGQTISRVFMTASVATIDGVSKTLAQASVDELALDSSGFYLTTDGSLTIDEADASNLFGTNQLENVIAHEIAHILGFGSLWGLNRVYVSGSGEFLGLNATAAWQSEFGQLGTPDVELAGGEGTANAHWNENTGGAGLTGITDSRGRDMRDELMTGWLNPNSFISDMTVASFIDIGFTGARAGAVAVPEPSSVVLCSVIAIGVIARRRIPARRASK